MTNRTELSRRARRCALAACAAAFVAGFSLTASALDLREGADETPAVAPRHAERPGNPACEARLAKAKIAIVFDESVNGVRSAKQSRYAGSFPIVAAALRDVGLKVIPQEEIVAAIARAETEAYLNNDTDAAIKAAARLGARYVLHATITQIAGRNALIRVNQVGVSIAFVLQDHGKVVSTATASGASFAGMDVAQAARDVVSEHAGDVVTDLYEAFCSG